MNHERKKSFGIHAVKESDILDRNKNKMLEIINSYKKIIDRSKPENTGLTNQEINGFKGEIKQFIKDVGAAKSQADLQVIAGELEGSKLNFDQLKKQRQEDVVGLLEKLEPLKETNMKLYHLKERNMDSAARKVAASQSGDIRNMVTNIEATAIELQKKMNMPGKMKKSQIKKQQEQMIKLYQQLDQAASKQHQMIVIQICKEQKEFFKVANHLNTKIDQIEIQNNNLTFRVSAIDANIFDDEEHEIFQQLKIDTESYKNRIADYRNGIKDLVHKQEELAQSLSLDAENYIDLYGEINAIDMRFESDKVDWDLTSKNGTVIQTIQQKSDKDSEMLKLVAALTSNLNQLNQYIQLKVKDLEERVEQINDCLLKKDVIDKNLPAMKEFNQEVCELFNEVLQLEQKRKGFQEELQKVVPAVLLKQRKLQAKRADYDFVKNFDMMSQGDQKIIIDYTAKLHELIMDTRQGYYDIIERSQMVSQKYADSVSIMSAMDEYRYEANEFDEIDVYIGKYCNAAGLDMGLKKVSEGVYEAGSKQVIFVMRDTQLLTQSASGKRTADAHEFLDGHYTKKIQKKNFLKQNVELNTEQSSEFTDFTTQIQSPARTKNFRNSDQCLTPSPVHTLPLDSPARYGRKSVKALPPVGEEIEFDQLLVE